MAKIKTTKTDPPVASVSDKIIASKTKLTDQHDVRDIMSSFVGGGHTSLADENVRAGYLRLKGLVGEQAAQKLVNSAFLYNQNPSSTKLSPEQRVQGFYTQGSSDPQISDYLKQGKGLGYGVLPGFRSSPLLSNMQLTGRSTGGGAGDAAATEKIKLLVRQKTK